MSECQAKNKTTCRVHGVQGVAAHLQTLADKAASYGNMNEYLTLREAAEEADETNYTEPVSNLEVYSREDWVENDGFRSNTPNNVLVDELNIGNDKAEKASQLLTERGYSEGEIIAAEHFGFDGYKNQNSDRYDFKEISGFNATTCYLAVQKKYEVEFSPSFIKEAGKTLHLNPAEPFQDVARGNVKNYVETLLSEAQKLKRRHGLHALN